MGCEKKTRALRRGGYIQRELAEAMARMAADADIRRESKAIAREFARAEKDGLK